MKALEALLRLVLGRECEEYVDAARSRRRAHRLGEALAAAAAREELGPGHADGGDAHGGAARHRLLVIQTEELGGGKPADVVPSSEQRRVKRLHRRRARHASDLR